jgi:hypothetical protein
MTGERRCAHSSSSSGLLMVLCNSEDDSYHQYGLPLMTA